MAIRKKIVKLAKKIAGPTALMFKIDENAPEYYVLECCVTDEMAEVGVAMELRKSQTIEQIAKKCGKSVKETQRLADELVALGACEVYKVGGIDLFELIVFVPGTIEKLVGNNELCEKYPQIARGFEEYARIRSGIMAPNLPVGVGPMRVIPIESAIDGNTRVASYEEISYFLNKNTLFSISDCSCRKSRRIMGEGCGHLEKDICIHMSTAAEAYIRSGIARQITREEAFEVVRKAEENGLMHCIPNIDGAETTYAICNCCSCGCYAVRNATLYNTPDMIRSNYVAQIDKNKCVACGQCVKDCPTNTLKLGKRLFSKTEPEAKETLSPRDHVWGEKNWNPDFRTNRENVVDTGTSYCKTKCPAHIGVQGYIKLASQGKYTEALELIKMENPLPAVCGRICPINCESACKKGDIDGIKKFIADQELNKDIRFIPKKRNEYGKQIAVIGAGPAGLACAYYLAIDGYKVTVFEKQAKLGGMLTLGTPSFRLEKEVVNVEIEILKELGVEFKTGVEVGKDVTLKELREQDYKAFYVAIGAQVGKKLGIEGEDAKGVITGVDFLRNINLGNDTKLKGKVVVIGGGNVAIDVARAAVREQTSKVDMFCLESREEMPALDQEIATVLEEKIVINNSWSPKRIVAMNGKVVGVEFKKCTSVFDESGEFNPQYNENETTTVDADFVLISVGQSIDWGNILEGSKLELNQDNTAKADSFTYQTTESDIFVGGDVYTGPKFAIDAIAAGKQGAISIHRFVWEGQSLIIGRDRRQYQVLGKANSIVGGFDTTKRQKSVHKQVFENNCITFTEEQMKKETEYCVGCGAITLDQEMCVGCGQCITKCKFDAIKLTKKYDAKGTTFEKLPLYMGAHIANRIGKIAIRAAKDAKKKKQGK